VKFLIVYKLFVSVSEEVSIFRP